MSILILLILFQSPSGDSGKAPGRTPFAEEGVRNQVRVLLQVHADLPKRDSVPDEATLERADKHLHETFKEEYSLKTSSEKIGVAKLFLAMATKPTNDLSTRFVLCREAVTIASGAGDVATALRAIDRMSDSFELDVSSLRQGVLTAAANTANKPEEFWVLAQGYLTMADEASRAVRFGATLECAEKALTFATRANSLQLMVRAEATLRETPLRRSAFEAFRKAQEILASNPVDPEANLRAGEFECLVLDHWPGGLKMLAKGMDPALKDLAIRELSNPAEAPEQLLLGDAWWDLSEKRVGAIRVSLRRHADFWYGQAGSRSQGPIHTAVAERHQKVEDALVAGRVIDLLRLIDAQKNAVLGAWSFEGSSLVCLQKLPAARLEIPYLPPDEYDLVLVVDRMSGGDAINVGLSRGNVQFHMVVDGYSKEGYASGLARIDGKYANDNETTRRGPLLVNHQPSTIECSVRNAGLSMKVDGKRIFEWSGDWSRLSIYDALKTPHGRALFISGWDSKVRFSQVTLIPVSGRGEILR